MTAMYCWAAANAGVPFWFRLPGRASILCDPNFLWVTAKEGNAHQQYMLQASRSWSGPADAHSPLPLEDLKGESPWEGANAEVFLNEGLMVRFPLLPFASKSGKFSSVKVLQAQAFAVSTPRGVKLSLGKIPLPKSN